MSREGSDDAEGREIARLRREVRALRNEIAGRSVPHAPRGSRGMMMAGAIGLCSVGGAILAAGIAIDLPTLPGFATMAEMVSAQAAAGIVERLFAVY